MLEAHSERVVATKLAKLYDLEFAGKVRGRYRISMKQFRALTGRRRVPAQMLKKIADELFELGFVLIDLESYFIVLAQSTFRSYRRVGDTTLAKVNGYTPLNDSSD